MLRCRLRSCPWIIGVIIGFIGVQPGWGDSNQDKDVDPPLTLKKCIHRALETNPLKQVALRGVQAAREATGEARAPYYPDLGLQTGYARWQQRAFLPNGLFIPGQTIPHIIGPTDDWMARLRTRYTLYDSGERQAQYQSALARQGVAEEEKARIIQDLIYSVHQSFYGLAGALEIRSVAGKNLVLVKDNLRLAKERKAAGAVSQADVLRAQVEVANAELALVKAENLVRISKGDLNTVMGQPIERPIEIELKGERTIAPDSTDLVKTMDQAVHNRPELKAAVKRIEAQRGDLEVAKSAFGPKIRAEGSYGWRDTDFLPRDEEWLAGISIEWPLFTGFFRQHRLARAKEEVFKEEAEAKQLLLKVRQEVWTAHSKTIETYEAVQATQVLVQDAQESLRMAKERYEVGAGTITDLLDAQTAMARAQANQVEAEWDYHLAKAAFDRSSGKMQEENAR